MNNRIIEKLNIDKFYLDIANWPTVNYTILDEDDQNEFLKRKKAIEMYMGNVTPVREILSETGIDDNTLRRLIKRCFEVDAEGVIWGYRALIPGKRIVDYSRKDNFNTLKAKNEDSKIGFFVLLLDTYPILKEKIIKLYFSKDKNAIKEPIIKGKYVHKRFIETCRQVGIKSNEYPFNTSDLARRSLYRYLKKLENIYFVDAARRSGEDAERLVRTTGVGEKNRKMIVQPYERVEFDGHKIDGIFTITFETPEGDLLTEVLERIWILVIIDVATRAALGYHISLNKEYSAEDVLQCIRNAVVPKRIMQFKITGLKYPENYGYPSLVIPDTEWALWDEFCYDNSKANLAEIVRDRLKTIVGCSVNPGPVKRPERRNLVERFFGLLEENGFHRLPNTTGNSPTDPRRNNAEKYAKQYDISYEDLIELVEVLIANYNVEPQSGINGRSPIECMQERINRGLIPRTMQEERRNDVAFLAYQKYCTVRGNYKKGRRPYITYEGVEYRNEVLSRSFELIGQKLNIQINIDDIRVLKAYLEDGSEFGYLTANGKWGVIPHSLKVRKQINKLIREKQVHIVNSDDPIQVYKEYLQSKAIVNKAARNRIAAQNLANKRYAEKDMEQSNMPQNQYNSKAENNEDENCDKTIVEIKTKKENQNELNAFRNKFKTITY